MRKDKLSPRGLEIGFEGYMLQLGHDLSVMETSITTQSRRLPGSALQLGHDLSVMET